MIAIVDYNAGNIRSVTNALSRLGAGWILTSDPAELRRADRVLLPGVGHAGAAAADLRARGLDTVICDLRRPVLGICVGMQVMCRDTEEGPSAGLGIFDAHVRRFIPRSDADKVDGTQSPISRKGYSRGSSLERGSITSTVITPPYVPTPSPPHAMAWGRV